jgi:hypothetical protein
MPPLRSCPEQGSEKEHVSRCVPNSVHGKQKVLKSIYTCINIHKSSMNGSVLRNVTNG